VEAASDRSTVSDLHEEQIERTAIDVEGRRRIRDEERRFAFRADLTARLAEQIADLLPRSLRDDRTMLRP
jgi:hypothetical protein